MSDTLITGRKPLLEALEQGRSIEKIFVLHGTRGSVIDSIFKLAKSRGIPVRLTSKDRFQKLAQGREAQGVAGVIGQVQYKEIEDLLAMTADKADAVVLVMDEIEDPHNLGALLRSALSFGISGAVIAKHHAATVNQTVIKTSAGAALQIPVVRVANIAQTVDTLKDAGFSAIGTDSAASQTLQEMPAGGKLAIVVGNEGKGIRRLVRQKCDQLVRIPMGGSFESLNASVAGAIVMYEAMRTRKGASLSSS